MDSWPSDSAEDLMCQESVLVGLHGLKESCHVLQLVAVSNLQSLVGRASTARGIFWFTHMIHINHQQFFWDGGEKKNSNELFNGNIYIPPGTKTLQEWLPGQQRRWQLFFPQFLWVHSHLFWNAMLKLTKQNTLELSNRLRPL